MPKFNLTRRHHIPLLENKTLTINSVQDALDLFAEVTYHFNSHQLIIYATAFTPEFYDLSSGLLGEILQKYANYHFQLAIVGDFSQYPSKVLPDFIRESNKGQQFFFLPTIAEASHKLTQVKLTAMKLQLRNELKRQTTATSP